MLGKALPGVRKRIRQNLERSLQKNHNGKPTAKETGASRWLRFAQAHLLENLDTLTSPAPVYAVSLAVFYFSGAYYQLGKRAWGLRYIFTHRVPASEQRFGYEVLGVLLIAQLAVQSYMHVRRTLDEAQEYHHQGMHLDSAALAPLRAADVSLDPQAYASNNALLLDADAVAPSQQIDAQRRRFEHVVHTPASDGPRYRLLPEEGPMRWITGRQQRKCTLCLEELKDPSVTTCGHVFCWSCIGEWLRERPECPLCRSAVLVQHVLPLRE
jgi:peroxin-10